MSVINPVTRELSAKIVYYGPGLSGKTTSLQAIYSTVRPELRGELISLATETDRTIFFDFLPLQVERVQGLALRFQLYTVPGQVFYGATRRLVLNGADGVVFVADSQPNCSDSNHESFDSLLANMEELGIDIEDFPLVFQYNKRDLPNAVPMDVLSSALNRFGAPEFGTCATTADGVLPALRAVTKLVVRSLTEQQPAVRRQIIDEDNPEPRQPEGIARSVYDASHKLSAQTEAQRPAMAAKPVMAVTTSSDRNAKPASVVPAGGMTFALLWPPEKRPAIQKIEDAIASAEWTRAVHGVTTLLADALASLPGMQSGTPPDTKAALLGIDGALYLRVCRLARTQRALTAEDALLALHVLVAVRIKTQMLAP